MFFFKPSKKELDITDALVRKEAKITIGGKPVVIRAFKLAQALEFFNALGNLKQIAELASTDFAAFNRLLLSKLPEILAYAAPRADIKAEDITLAEFADLLMAIYCVNDIERVLANFTKAVQSMPKLTPALAVSQKQ